MILFRPDPEGPQVPPLLVGEAPPLLSFIGEAPGLNEEIYQRPFIGYAGDTLRRLISEAFFPSHPPSYYLTNVFKVRPEKNDVSLFFGPRQSAAPGYPPCGPGRYLLPDYTRFLTLLLSEAPLLQSKLLIALGNTALWALTGRTGISKLRGIILESPLGLPVLPTYHPAFLLKDPSARPLVVADLAKAASFLRGTQDPNRGKFDLTLDPSLEQLPSLLAEARQAPRISVDVETSRGQITVLGFGFSPRRAICIPFWNPETFQNYWPTTEAELTARRFCLSVLQLPCPKVLHNGMYDTQYLLAEGFSWRGPLEDTMLLHHALQPELPKSLGFLGATYTDEPEWKSLRRQGRWKGPGMKDACSVFTNEAGERVRILVSERKEGFFLGIKVNDSLEWAAEWFLSHKEAQALYLGLDGIFRPKMEITPDYKPSEEDLREVRPGGIIHLAPDPSHRPPQTPFWLNLWRRLVGSKNREYWDTADSYRRRTGKAPWWEDKLEDRREE